MIGHAAHASAGSPDMPAHPDLPGPSPHPDAEARRAFVLRYVQPGLAGLIDGSVSTLAPIFAAAFATHDSWNAFVVGLAFSVITVALYFITGRHKLPEPELGIETSRN